MEVPVTCVDNKNLILKIGESYTVIKIDVCPNCGELVVGLKEKKLDGVWNHSTNCCKKMMSNFFGYYYPYPLRVFFYKK